MCWWHRSRKNLLFLSRSIVCVVLYLLIFREVFFGLTTEHISPRVDRVSCGAFSYQKSRSTDGKPCDAIFSHVTTHIANKQTKNMLVWVEIAIAYYNFTIRYRYIVALCNFSFRGSFHLQLIAVDHRVISQRGKLSHERSNENALRSLSCLLDLSKEKTSFSINLRSVQSKAWRFYRWQKAAWKMKMMRKRVEDPLENTNKFQFFTLRFFSLKTLKIQCQFGSINRDVTNMRTSGEEGEKRKRKEKREK